MDSATILATVAAFLAGAGALFRALKRDVEGALVAAGLTLIAVAAAVGKL